MFNISCLLFVIGISNLSGKSSMSAVQWIFRKGGQAVVAICLMEIIIDWAKYGFVTKFNNHSASIFSKYTTKLCKEYISIRVADESDRTNPIHLFHLIDSSRSISNKLGFVSMPLCVLVIFSFLILSQQFLSQVSHSILQSLPNVLSFQRQHILHFVNILLLWSAAIVVKITISIGIFGHSAKRAMEFTKRANVHS